MLRITRLFPRAILALLSILVLPAMALQSQMASAADAATAGPVYDLRERPMPRILSGTVIGASAPKTWSHLVIKSQPRVAQGDVNDAPKLTISLARLLSFSIVANVKGESAKGMPPFVLDIVAIGLGTQIDGQDVIINSNTQAELGANLGLLARSVLSGTEDELKLIKQVLRSPTMLVFDVPTSVLVDNEHRRIVVRHAFVVDAASGQLNTLVWLVDVNSAGEYTQAIGTMNLLPPNMVEDRLLSVDAREFTLGIPSNKALAMVRIPPGQPISIPSTLLSVAAAARFTEETARELDAGLRALIGQAPRERSTVRKNPGPAAANAQRAGGK